MAEKIKKGFVTISLFGMSITCSDKKAIEECWSKLSQIAKNLKGDAENDNCPKAFIDGIQAFELAIMDYFSEEEGGVAWKR